MAWAWNPYSAAGLLAWVLAWVLAAVVFAAAPGRPANRRLAAVLFFDGAVMLILGGLNPQAADPATAYALRAVQAILTLAVPTLYLRFLATLDAPVVRPLRHPWVDRVLLALTFAMPLTWFVSSEWLITGVMPGVAYPWRGTWGPLWRFWNERVLLGALLLSLVAGFQAYRRAQPGSPRRAQALAYLSAFAVRDLLFVVLIVAAMPLFHETVSASSELLVVVGFPISSLVFAVLVAYAILKTQLFDIDLRLKKGIRQSTVAAVFIALFFVASESAAAFLGDRVGTFAGIAAAGGLVFVLAPLQRLAERVADTAMPGVDATPAYLTYRKMQVYRAAVEGVFLDGVVTAREREMLRRLREELAIPEADALALEADLHAAGAVRPPGGPA